MIFRQMFDSVSCTYTYLLAGRQGGEALIIDPVLDKVDRYLQLIDELDVKLVKALDTHVHADHITALGALRDRTKCITVMGAESAVDLVSMRVSDGDSIDIDGVNLTALHTPGHTDDSYCFTMNDRVFTGDTLLIRGTGRTDFQNGSSEEAYDSLFGKLLSRPDETLIYPGHDYKGDTVSTIGEERKFNPRLQVGTKQEYAVLMNGLNLADPQMMDVAVPNNLKIGLSLNEIDDRGWSLDVTQATALVGDDSAELVDLRDRSERKRHGVIPGSVHAPYLDLDTNVKPGGILHELSKATGRRLVFYCAYGERSGMAVQAANGIGLDACHIKGGIDAWKKAGAPLEPHG
jgi:glyoxylase-like metal-dependent hydrolase (beta-lactamase superfamily II)/rhodanese-related sulfurtransferase